MTSLFTSDIHMTTSPQEEYRWGLLPWLTKQAMKRRVQRLFILGDLTEAKDRHPAPLVNRLADQLDDFVHKADAEVIIIPGNHDYIDPAHPFFGFARHIPGVTFITKPTFKEVPIVARRTARCWFLPSTRNPDDWADLDFGKADYIFTHQTYTGALSESGYSLSGFSTSLFGRSKARILSGDIHVPQIVGKRVEYIGAPYRTRFGDTFSPRCLLIGEDGDLDLHFPCPEKHLIVCDSIRSFKSELKAVRAQEGDLIKVRFRLDRAGFADWQDARRQIIEISKDMGLVLASSAPVLVGDRQPTAKGDYKPAEAIHPRALMEDQVKREKLPSAFLEIGLALAGQAGIRVGKSQVKRERL